MLKKPDSTSPDESNVRYVGRQEAARVLGISVRHLIRLANNDPTFPPIRRIGRHPKWFLPDLLSWMEQRPS